MRYLGSVGSQEGCSALARAAGQPYYGLQSVGLCFAGSNISDWTVPGNCSSACPNQGGQNCGGDCASLLFERTGGWVQGCWRDNVQGGRDRCRAGVQLGGRDKCCAECSNNPGPKSGFLKRRHRNRQQPLRSGYSTTTHTSTHNQHTHIHTQATQ